MSLYRIPVNSGGVPQTFSIVLGGATYSLSFLYRNVDQGGWFLDISDSVGNPILSGLPMVTGVNLLEPYDYLNFGGGLVVSTQDGDGSAVPTFENFGDTANLYWGTT